MENNFHEQKAHGRLTGDAYHSPETYYSPDRTYFTIKAVPVLRTVNYCRLREKTQKRTLETETGHLRNNPLVALFLRRFYFRRCFCLRLRVCEGYDCLQYKVNP